MTKKKSDKFLYEIEYRPRDVNGKPGKWEPEKTNSEIYSVREEALEEAVKLANRFSQYQHRVVRYDFSGIVDFE